MFMCVFPFFICITIILKYVAIEILLLLLLYYILYYIYIILYSIYIFFYGMGWGSSSRIFCCDVPPRFEILKPTPGPTWGRRPGRLKPAGPPLHVGAGYGFADFETYAAHRNTT